jgi:AcrR family transcriptional regulator
MEIIYHGRVAVPTPSKRSIQTRSELARAAHDQIARTGTLNASAIADDAGVSTATFYVHFATHDDAIAAALDITLAAIVDVARRHINIETLLERGVKGVIDDVVHEIHSIFRAESQVTRMAIGRFAHHPGIYDVYRHHEKAGFEHLTRQIELAQRAGLLDAGTPTHRATCALVLMQGINNPLLTKSSLDPEVAMHLRQAIVAALGVPD